MAIHKKEAIIAKAISLFNRDGFGAVSMNQLAKELFMSRGNLAYHFKNKGILLSYLLEQMEVEIQEIRKETLNVPSFESITEEFLQLQEIQLKYQFIFFDTNVRSIERVTAYFKGLSNQSISDYKKVIALSIKYGTIQAEQIPGTYAQLCKVSWMTAFYWISQHKVRSLGYIEEVTVALWAIWLPYFTKKGVLSLSKHKGEDIRTLLGDSFHDEMASILKI